MEPQIFLFYYLTPLFCVYLHRGLANNLIIVWVCLRGFNNLADDAPIVIAHHQLLMKQNGYSNCVHLPTAELTFWQWKMRTSGVMPDECRAIVVNVFCILGCTITTQGWRDLEEGRVSMNGEIESERERKRQEINKKMGSDRDCLFVFPTKSL